MNYQQTGPTNQPGAERRGSEAELLAEILARMDASQKAAGGAARGGADAERTIDLVELFYFFLSKLHYVLLGMVLGAVALGYYAAFCVTPVYSATAKLYIMGTTGSSIITDLQIGSVLTMDYQEVFKTWEVHQMVNEDLGTDYSYSDLQDMISVSNPSDTRVLYITAKHPDPQKAADIANAYASAAKRFIVQTMQTDEPSTFSIALVPGTASGRGIKGYALLGVVLGTVVACGILVLIFLLDNRPKSPEDVMRYAHIPTLAVIPVNSTSQSGAKKRGRKAGKA